MIRFQKRVVVSKNGLTPRMPLGPDFCSFLVGIFDNLVSTCCCIVMLQFEPRMQLLLGIGL
jgi:hypothetical protein